MPAIKKRGRILITGCSGFIGRAVVREALRQGYRVNGLDLKDCSVKGIRFVKGDINDYGTVKRAIKRADRVIHLAAVTSNLEFYKDMRSSYNTNVGGFLNVINAAAISKCKSFIYASSAAVYLKESGFSELAHIDIRKQGNHYAKTKLINEMIADSYEERYNMNSIGMRLFNVFGPGENQKGNYASIITILLKMEKNGKPLLIYGDGSQSRDLIYVDDVAKITLILLEKGKNSIYNVGTGRANAYGHIADLIGPKHKKFVKNPLSSYQTYTKADTARLKKVIGKFNFIGLEQGIRNTKAELG